MGTFRMLLMDAILAALVTAGLASQLFEELPLQSLGKTRMYQDGHDLDPGLYGVRTSEVDVKNILGQDEGEKALFLFKVIQALRMQNEDAEPHRSVIPEAVDFLDIQIVPEGGEQDEEKLSMMKRKLSKAPKPQVKTNVQPKSSVEIQPWWKAKKGSQMICYFKLCGYRVLS